MTATITFEYGHEHIFSYSLLPICMLFSSAVCLEHGPAFCSIATSMGRELYVHGIGYRRTNLTNSMQQSL